MVVYYQMSMYTFYPENPKKAKAIAAELCRVPNDDPFVVDQ